MPSNAARARSPTTTAAISNVRTPLRPAAAVERGSIADIGGCARRPRTETQAGVRHRTRMVRHGARRASRAVPRLLRLLLRRDRDPTRLGALGLRDLEREHAVLNPRHDTVAVDVVRQGESP